MFILKAEDIKMEIDGELLFKDAFLEVKERERVALIGDNGVGKTTFIKGILGMSPIVKGNVEWNIQKSDAGFMLQDSDMNSELTVREYVEEADNHKSRLKKELNRLTLMLSDEGNAEVIIPEYQEILQKYLDVNGYQWETEVSKILNQFSIPETLWETPFYGLSGGQKTRVKLARAMIPSPKLLILDEPTNHLDMETVEWLQHWLQRYQGSILFTSHEREFLDAVADVTFEISEKGTKKYQGGYRSYKAVKDLELKSIESLYEKQEQERKKLIETIQTYKNWYQQANRSASVRNPYAQKQAAKQASKYKAKEKALERLENSKLEKPAKSSSINANFEANLFLAKKMIELERLDFSYENRLVLQNIGLQINRGDRIAVIGKNGSGKTTLLKLMTGQLLPCKGVIKRNPQLKIGYFFQELENLNHEHTVVEEILELPNISLSEARTILACFLFRKEEVNKKVKHLSMGEKCRVAFVKLFFSEANLLILDEPTNYLDILTREKVEDALVNYTGSVVIVSHDPFLLRKVANKVVKIEDAKAVNYTGSYMEWEKHSLLTPQVQKLVNQQKMLELELLDLLNQVSNQEETNILQKIREVKQKIDGVRQEIEYLKNA